MALRNDPCPCGSGKKYKKCCLKKATKVKVEPQVVLRNPLDAPTSLAELGVDLEVHYYEELDRVSNSVLPMIRARNFDEALSTCARLLDEWPDFADGLERSARVHEAMGDLEKAKDFYARTIAFTQQHEGYEDGGLAAACQERISAIDARRSATS